MRRTPCGGVQGDLGTGNVKQRGARRVEDRDVLGARAARHLPHQHVSQLAEHMIQAEGALSQSALDLAVARAVGRIVGVAVAHAKALSLLEQSPGVTKAPLNFTISVQKS